MVGRWPSGAPLVKAPHQDDPTLADDNLFLYHPLGRPAMASSARSASHIRRTNPRDALDPHARIRRVNRSRQTTSRHAARSRLRAAGGAVDGPADILGSRGRSPANAGCTSSASIRTSGASSSSSSTRWVNSPKFDGLYDDDDPLIGDRGAAGKDAGGDLHRPGGSPSESASDRPAAVRARPGRGYFFMPGIRALRFLAALP